MKEIFEVTKEGITSNITVLFNEKGYILGVDWTEVNNNVTDMDEEENRLNVKLQEAIDNENYSNAEKIKKQIEQLKYVII
jgi:protein-arginine kinase activator protein McsA